MSRVNTRQSGDGSAISARTVAILAGVALVLVFIFQNTASTKLKVIFFTLEMPRWIGFVLVLLIGALIGWLWRGRSARS